MADKPPTPTKPNIRVSKRFCATDVDVIFQSDDGVLFHIHRKNLETHTEGFPPAGFDTQNDIVALSEQSTTLELLFQFIYPVRHPDLASVTFEKLEPIAEAAEKYQVFSAMNICKIRMMNTLPEHAETIMGYAVKHDYPEIMGAAAPLLLDKSLEEIIVKLPPNLIIPWTRYYGEWVDCIRSASSRRSLIYGQGLTSEPDTYYGIANTDSKVCGKCKKTPEGAIIQILGELHKGTASLRHLDRTFNSSFLCCNHMKPALVAWRSTVEVDIQNIPNFMTFL